MERGRREEADATCQTFLPTCAKGTITSTVVRKRRRGKPSHSGGVPRWRRQKKSMWRHRAGVARLGGGGILHRGRPANRHAATSSIRRTLVVPGGHGGHDPSHTHAFSLSSSSSSSPTSTAGGGGGGKRAEAYLRPPRRIASQQRKWIVPRHGPRPSTKGLGFLLPLCQVPRHGINPSEKTHHVQLGVGVPRSHVSRTRRGRQVDFPIAVSTKAGQLGARILHRPCYTTTTTTTLPTLFFSLPPATPGGRDIVGVVVFHFLPHRKRVHRFAGT